MKKSTRSREFNEKTRKIILNRDETCIFCKMGYHMEDVERKGQGPFSIMHFISRAQNGLGIEQNGALGCQTHHDMLDNGYQGRRDEMLQIFGDYLADIYPNWNPKTLVHDKWSFLNV